MTPEAIRKLLQSSSFALLARILLTLPFWMSGLVKLIDFNGGVAEMEHYGFFPGTAFNLATIIVQLGGSFLVIINRLTWLGAGALGVFTGLTILLVHNFWAISDGSEKVHMFFALEHIGMIGGLILASILGERSNARAA
jgi:transmembrane protein